MKYIKTFERLYKSDGQIKQGLTKKTVDYNKIYTFDRDGDISNIGKISTGKFDNKKFNGSVMTGYNIKTGESIKDPIRYGTWRWIREATQDEIEKYEAFDKINKFNL